MGKPPIIPHDVLKASILERDVVDRNGQVHGTSHPVWKELANFHQNKITDNYAYVYVKTNRHGIYDQILKDKGIKQPSPNSSSEDTGEDFEDGDGDEKEIKRDLKPSTTFQVLISAEKWQKMKPHDTVSKRSERPNPRVRRVLPQFIWQPIVIECLWDQHKLPCPYSFTRGSVFNSDTRDCFIKMAANCNECGAVAEGRILMEPADNEVVPLEWSANDTRGIPHVKKRPLSHNLREDLTKELQGGSAAAWRKLEASKKMQHGDTEPPNLFTQRVLRKAQQQQMDKKYGIVQDSSDPIKNLQDMKIRQPHAASIHQIGLDPFFVHYHTKTQLHVFKKFVSLGHVVLAIDATGSLVRKVSNGEGHKSAHIFLYEGVIKASGEQLPVMQMLSARQDANNIAFWINEYLRQGSPIPHEVVLDHSKALINAVVVTFCGCNNLKDYFSRCFYVLQNDASLSDRELDRITPQSYLRLDIAHLIGGAAKWKEWRDESTKRLKLFYMQCLGLLVLENSLGGFQDTFIMVGLIAHSQLVGAEVAKSMKTLTDRILGSEIEISDLVKTEESDDDFDDPEFDPLIDDVDEDVDGYLKKIKEEIASRRCEKGPGELNAYYSPAVLKRFYNLLPDFLLWSGVLVETFQSPTAYGSSARVESDFNQIKNGILSGKKRTVRLDRFVAMHLRHVDGSCHLAEADHNLNIYQKSNETGSDGNEEDEEKSGEGHEEESSSDSDAETPDRGSAEDGGQDTGDKAADKPDRGGDPSKSPFKKRNIRKRRAEDHDDDNDTEHQKSLNESENWRGQAPTPKKSKTAKYLNPFPELSAVMNAKSLEPPKEILLKNGLHIGFCKTSATSHAQLKNTCAFDVLAQLTSSAYIQYEMYRNGLEPYLTGSDFFQTCLSLVEKGAVNDTYQLRLQTLAKMTTPSTVIAPKKSTLRSRQSSVSITYDCFADLVDLSRELLNDAFSVSLETKCSLGRPRRPCTPLEQQNIVCADVEVLHAEGLAKLEKAVLVSLKMNPSSEFLEVQNPFSTMCPKPGCAGLATINCTFGPHLFINVDIFGSSDTLPLAKKPSLKITDVPIKLQLFGTTFVLCGIGARKSIHYVAYARKATGLWEMFNDLARRVIKVKNNEEIEPVLLMYIPLSSVNK